MSCYKIYYDKETKCKMMQVVKDREEYLQLRDSSAQKAMVRQVRSGGASPVKGEGVDTICKLKAKLLQFNYSCIPGEDMKLKGCTTPSNTVGMDVDHIAKEQMQEVKERILARKDELGLLMLELSARGEGYHLVFKRKDELSQEDNLRWASDLLGVEFDKGAKDITRVFFATTASEEDLIFLDDEIFSNSSLNAEGDKSPLDARGSDSEGFNVKAEPELLMHVEPAFNASESEHLTYLGIPYAKIIKKII